MQLYRELPELGCDFYHWCLPKILNNTRELNKQILC